MDPIIGLIIISILFIIGIVVIIKNRYENTSDFIGGILSIVICLVACCMMTYFIGIEIYTKNIINRLLSDKKIEIVYVDNKISYKLIDGTMKDTYTYVINVFNKSEDN
jgi:riboflavin transporter FmnP